VYVNAIKKSIFLQLTSVFFVWPYPHDLYSGQMFYMPYAVFVSSGQFR